MDGDYATTWGDFNALKIGYYIIWMQISFCDPVEAEMFQYQRLGVADCIFTSKNINRVWLINFKFFEIGSYTIVHVGLQLTL